MSNHPDTSEWLRISSGCTYFSLKFRGISDDTSEPAYHWHALIHIPGMDRRKLFFAIQQSQSVALVHLLEQGQPGEEYHAELLAKRGYITATISADGQRTIVFEILASSRLRGAKGMIQGYYRKDLGTVRTLPPQPSTSRESL